MSGAGSGRETQGPSRDTPTHRPVGWPGRRPGTRRALGHTSPVAGSRARMPPLPYGGYAQVQVGVGLRGAAWPPSRSVRDLLCAGLTRAAVCALPPPRAPPPAAVSPPHVSRHVPLGAEADPRPQARGRVHLPRRPGLDRGKHACVAAAKPVRRPRCLIAPPRCSVRAHARAPPACAWRSGRPSLRVPVQPCKGARLSGYHAAGWPGPVLGGAASQPGAGTFVETPADV